MAKIVAKITLIGEEKIDKKRDLQLTVTKIGLVSSTKSVVTFSSLKTLSGFLQGVKFLAESSGMTFEFQKPGTLYQPLGSSGMHYCPLCWGSGHEHTLQHKQFCPNYEEGKPFTPDYEHY
ncbi:MAG: hypothetical protein HYW90_02000 [Candidatus Sungbacteria bacterium]|nr:hypothetical protein [Candidatus Sungbacteria bacterium]